MGLLDEAIREHLELKRRHGADAAEVARLEQEALGPARRTPADVAQEAGTGPDEVTEEPAAPPKPASAEELPPDSAEAEAPTTVHVPLAEDDEYEYVLEDEEFGGAAEPAPAPAPPPIPAPEQQTVEFEPASEEEWADDWDAASEEPEPHVPPARGAAGEAGGPAEAGSGGETAGEEGEDVLEETPDFLQETPEHDRLWFEQKPPRDFDF